MSCASDPVIPMLDCCQTDLCFPSYQVYAERDVDSYFKLVEVPSGRTRYFLAGTFACQIDPKTGAQSLPLTMSINRYDYSVTLDHALPYGNICPDLASVGTGGATVEIPDGGSQLPGANLTLSSEITYSEILSDLEALLATPFPVPGEHVLINVGGTAIVTVPGLPNVRRVGAPMFRLWPQFNSAGVIQRTARGYDTGSTESARGVGGRGSTLPLGGNCWWAGRLYFPGAQYAAAQKMRVNLQGAYCIADDVARTCESSNVGSTWTQIDILPPTIPAQFATYNEGNRFLDTGCLCPFT